MNGASKSPLPDWPRPIRCAKMAMANRTFLMTHAPRCSCAQTSQLTASNRPRAYIHDLKSTWTLSVVPNDHNAQSTRPIHSFTLNLTLLLSKLGGPFRGSSKSTAVSEIYIYIKTIHCSHANGVKLVLESHICGVFWGLDGCWSNLRDPIHWTKPNWPRSNIHATKYTCIVSAIPENLTFHV